MMIIASNIKFDTWLKKNCKTYQLAPKPSKRSTK